jgi:short-subunit dehydrogenase
MKSQYALITGASSGFGKDFAHILASKGLNLIITARRVEKLEQLKSEIKKSYDIDIIIIPADLSQHADRIHLLNETQSLDIEILINNAGLGIHGDYLNANFEEINKMIQVDITALTHLTHEIGLRMKKKKSGKILLLGSIAAFLPTPTYAAYAAAKSYVLSLGQSLNYELRNHGVSVTVLNPGATATEFFEVSGQKMTFYQKLFMMQSMPVAKLGIKALFKGQSSIVPGIINKLTAFLTRLSPVSLNLLVAHKVMKN